MDKTTNYTMIERLFKKHPEVLEQYVKLKFRDSVHDFYDEMVKTGKRYNISISQKVIVSAMSSVVSDEEKNLKSENKIEIISIHKEIRKPKEKGRTR